MDSYEVIREYCGAINVDILNGWEMGRGPMRRGLMVGCAITPHPNISPGRGAMTTGTSDIVWENFTKPLPWGDA